MMCVGEREPRRIEAALALLDGRWFEEYQPRLPLRFRHGIRGYHGAGQAIRAPPPGASAAIRGVPAIP